MFCSSSILQGGCRLVGAQVAQTTSACRLKLPPVGRGQFGTCCFCNACYGVDLQLPYTSTFELLPVQCEGQDNHDDRRSPRGKRVGLLLDEVNKTEAEKVAQVAILLILISKEWLYHFWIQTFKFPSTAQSSMWSTFHQLHGSQEMKQICIHSLS